MVLVCFGVGFSMGCGTCTSKKPPVKPVAPAGQLPHNGMPKNGIHPEVLHASQELLERLKSKKLDGVELDDVKPFTPLVPELEPLAVQLMEYIVYFALDEGQTVSLDVNGKHYTWNGHMGVCAKSGTTMGDWFNENPTNACLEAVSASVLARVNALDKVVVLSMRGAGSPIAPLNKVPVETRSREKNGSTGEATEIESFSKCDGGGGPGSETANCGWSARYVGRCLALKGDEKNNRSVTLKVKPAPTIASPVFVRVCAGIHGCNQNVYNEPNVRNKYIKPIKSDKLESAGDTVEFTCPSNGPHGMVEGEPLEQWYGYFSIMLSEKSLQVDVESPDQEIEGLVYPSPEVDVFRYREGAFYGNIFDSTSASDAGITSKTLFDKQYACFGEDWKLAAANVADRLCALPLDDANSNCLFNVPTSCLNINSSPVSRSACDKTLPMKGFVYTACGGADPHWAYPITTYLNHPCDLRSAAECSSLDTWTFGGDSLP
ncbi:hypothetical protein WME94_55970 [Sorangium sp. So ce429]